MNGFCKLLGWSMDQGFLPVGGKVWSTWNSWLYTHMMMPKNWDPSPIQSSIDGQKIQSSQYCGPVEKSSHHQLRLVDYPISSFTSFFTSKRWFPRRISEPSTLPIGFMYGIFTYIHHKNHLNVGKYTIHGSYGLGLDGVHPIIIL